MSNDRSRSHRRIVWLALCASLLSLPLTGCFSSDRVDPPLDNFNFEFLYLLSLDGDTYDSVSAPESLAFVDDKTLAIGTEDAGVYFADLSDPAKPAVVGVFEHEGAGIVNILAMDGFVYGYARTAEFLAIDARQPAASQQAFGMPGRKPDHNWALNVADVLLAAEDGFLYVSMEGGIHIFNTADPYALALEGAYYPPQTRARWPLMFSRPAAAPTPRQLQAEKAHGNFIAHEDYPSADLPCSRTFIENARILGAMLDDGLLYVWVDKVVCVGREEVEDGGVWVLDVSDPSEPLAIGFLSLPEVRAYAIGVGLFDKFGVAIAGNNLFLSAMSGIGDDDSTVVDVSDPKKPFLSDNLVDADWVVTKGSLLLASIVHVHDNGVFNKPGKSNGLQIFDVSDVANPILIGMMSEVPGTGLRFSSIADIAYRAGYIYVAEDSGIYVLRLIDRNWRPDDAPAETSDTSP